jgi:hypothetical protein
MNVMFLLEIEKIVKDSKVLYNEYVKEDKEKYQQLFNSQFQSKIREQLQNKELNCCASNIKDFDGIEIQILVFLYSKVETRFYSPHDLLNYAEKLRKIPAFRDFTKLCFYIEKNIESR